MDVMVKNCCGLDVHQKTVVACTLVGKLSSNRPKKTSKTFGTRTFELKELALWLKEQQITTVLMESTGQYWRPVWAILEKENFKLILANPQRIKGIAGRKTDQKDAEWIAELGRMGLVASSYVPPIEIQELRGLTRTRSGYIREITQHKNRIHNILQQANIKLTSFLTDIYGKTGRNLIELLISGEKITEEVISPLIHGKVKANVSDLLEAMDGVFSTAHLVELDTHFTIIDCLEKQIEILSQEIDSRTRPYQPLMDRLITIPGIKKATAEVILSEIGTSIDSFKTVKHLASWSGLCPGSYESGGVRKGARITKGNKYLKTALYHSGRTAGHSKSEVFSNFFHRIASRGSKQKAVIATAHKILRVIYKTMETYSEEQQINTLKDKKSYTKTLDQVFV